MRIALTLLLLMLAAGPGQARQCQLPLITRDSQVPTRFLSCLLDEIGDLKREQARLRRALDDLQGVAAELPGEFRNENGQTTQTPNRTLTEATLILSSRSISETTSLPLKQDVMETLCAETGGCMITLFLRPEGLRETDPASTVATGPCLFDYDATNGAWVRGGACGDDGALAGADGNGRPGGTDGGEIIASAAGACILADSDPGLSVGPDTSLLGRDHARGLFLIAAPSLGSAGLGRFRCELKIE